MRLRPHHLLCTQGYSGKGYSDDFVANMDKVTEILRNQKGTKLQLVFDTDDICQACPNMLGDDLCEANEKVKAIDQKVIQYFNLEEKEYVYDEIVGEIKSKITVEVMDDICKDCQWYPISACKKRILP